MIHATAIVESGAKIGAGTVIGPGAIIGSEVVIGENCEIRAHAIITGKTTMGDRNQIGYGAVIGAEPQDLTYKGGTSFVHIGNDNVIREHSTIHRGTKDGSATVVGNNNYFMCGVHLAHNCEVGNRVILVNNVLLGGYVKVEDQAFLGGSSIVHQFARIGSMVMVRGGTALGQDVPPYCMAVATNAVFGLNRVGLKRNGISPDTRRLIMKAYNTLYYSKQNYKQALETMKNAPEFQIPEIKRFTDFLSGTKRGICRAIKSSDMKSAANSAAVVED